MSGKTIGFKPSDQTRKRLNEFRDDEGLNKSRALEKVVDRGLESHGYGSIYRDTRLSRVSREGVRFGGYSSAVVVGLHLTTPLNLSAAVIALLAAALLMALVERFEPAITEQAANLRRRPAVTDGGDPE